MNSNVVMILAVLIVYITLVIFAINRWDTKRKMEVYLDQGTQEGMKLLFFERMVTKALDLQPERIAPFIHIERITIIALLLIATVALHGLALLAFGAVLVVVYFHDAYKACIYDSGITNIPNIVNFINYFVPHINSGNSADQSFLGYIEYSGDVGLAEYYERKEEPGFALEPHLRQIVDIYEIAKYNEEKGI